MKTPKHQSGFTLIEVLIAMTVIALAMSAIIQSASTAAYNTSHIRDKTFAHWVAQNHMESLRLEKAFPDIGDKETEVEMVDRKWKINTKVSETPEKDLRRIDIRVRGESDPKSTSITLLTGFLGKP